MILHLRYLECDVCNAPFSQSSGLAFPQDADSVSESDLLRDAEAAGWKCDQQRGSHLCPRCSASEEQNSTRGKSKRVKLLSITHNSTLTIRR